MEKKSMIELEEHAVEYLYGQVSEIVENARSTAFKQVNLLQIVTNLLVGKRIVEDEQQGNIRAKYGKSVLKQLSLKLTKKYGRGFSVDNLPESVKLIVFICQSTIRLAKSRKCTLIMLNKPVLM